MPSDIEISRAAKMLPIGEVAARLGIPDDAVEPYGRYKAKISAEFIASKKGQKDGKLILVTAINPTPAGEGKTTTSVGLTDGLNRIGRRTMLCLREPSLGPCFGMKGGAAGGGYSQVVPMEEINLHFTGDFHAITSALPQWIWLSIIAASRLCALVMAWKSPVKWRLISSIGTTWE